MPRGCCRSGSIARWAILALVAAAVQAAAPGVGRTGEWVGGGPEIGWIRALLEASDGTLYAGTWGGGIFRSTDGGEHWSAAAANVPDAVVLDLAEGRDPARTLYAAAVNRAVLRKELSSDFWSPLGGYPGGSRPVGVCLEVFPTYESRIGFGTEDGAFVSDNRGLTWPDTLTFASSRLVTDLVVLPEIGNTIHALTPSEIITTVNTGQSEDFFSEGLAPAPFLLDLEPWSSGTDSLLVADQAGPVWQFVERRRFREVGPLETGTPSNKYVCRVDATDADRILVGSSAGLWVSEDRLASWSLVADPALGSTAPEIWAIEPTRTGPADALRMGTFSFGFVRTGPGGQPPWTVSNTGLTAAWARSVHATAASTLCGTAHGRLFRSVDAGTTWQDVTGPLGTLQISVAHDTGSAWIVSGSEGVVRSGDGGGTWQPVVLPPGVRRLNRVAQTGSTVFGASNSGLVVSLDDGVSFARVEAVPEGRPGFALAVAGDGTVAVALDQYGSGLPPTLHVGDLAAGFVTIEPEPGFRASVRGLGFVEGDLLVGAGGSGESTLYRIGGWAGPGRSFTDLSTAIADGFFEVRDLAVRANVVAIGTAEDGVFVSTDLGRSWSECNEGLPSQRVESLAFGPAPGRMLWVATLGRGVYARELDAGVPVVVSGLRVEPDPSGVRLRIAVHRPGSLRVWREVTGQPRIVLFEGTASQDLDLVDEARLPAAGIVAYVAAVGSAGGWVEVERVEREVGRLVAAKRSRVLVAAPNPFNPRTTVRFELASAGPVRLDVHDARGRRVRGLVDRHLVAGPHEVGFDGRDDQARLLASGVYFLRLRTPDGVSRGRLTLVR